MAKIFSLSEAGSIALHGMVLIARTPKEEKLVNVALIASATTSSRHHVAKIMQRLVKEGYLNSYRGPGGGFILNKSASEITLLEIYEAIEGKLHVANCPMDKPVCPFDKCLMDNIVHKMTTDFREFLHSQTLADFLK